MGWQPIDSAPRDGTEILVRLNGRTAVSHFYSEETHSFGKPIRKSEGWRSSSFFAFPPRDFEPTHWHPLPPFDVPITEAGQVSPVAA